MATPTSMDPSLSGKEKLIALYARPTAYRDDLSVVTSVKEMRVPFAPGASSLLRPIPEGNLPVILYLAQRRKTRCNYLLATPLGSTGIDVFDLFSQ